MKRVLSSWAIWWTAVAIVSACRPIEPPAATDTIQAIVWQWTSLTDQTTSDTQPVPNPEAYTLVFDATGVLSGQADCNMFFGTYSEDEGFSIELDAITNVLCGDGSLGQQYLQLLEEVVAGGSDGVGGLALETAGGAERMMFQNGGEAPTP